MIVRARLKHPDDVPDLICCDYFRQRLLTDLPSVEIEVDPAQAEPYEMVCDKCGHYSPRVMAVRIVRVISGTVDERRGMWTTLDVLELDEGPAPSASPEKADRA